MNTQDFHEWSPRSQVFLIDPPVWRVELFGGLRLARGAFTRTDFRTHRTGSVLGYLAYFRGKWHPRHLLAELFWPEDLPERALRSLETALRTLSLELEPPGIEPGTILLQERERVCLSGRAVLTDVAEFRERIELACQCHSRARRLRLLLVAVEQYRPDLLPGHRDEWLLPAQAELEDLYIWAALTLTRDLSAAGHLDESLRVARRALEVDPLAEKLHRQVARLLQRRGDLPSPALNRRPAQVISGASSDAGGPGPSGSRRLTGEEPA
ncbi:MAG TPA: BTAD domain-containing putative transcriptional regulator [Armatimonadota bacterium]|nr:BTAD domain-containing putative transcriptional regulator [Armatimonadota bacterium]